MYDSNTAATAERKTSDSPSVVSSTAPSKRVILTMGGKGGVGKTALCLPSPNGSRAMRFR